MRRPLLAFCLALAAHVGPIWASTGLQALLPDLHFQSGQSTNTVELSALKVDQGWAFDPTVGAWGIGDRSNIKLSFSPARQTLVITGKPFLFQGATVQWVDVLIDENFVRRLRLVPWMHTYRVRLPQEWTGEKEAQVSLRYRWWRRPQEVLSSSSDHRPLAVRWIGLGLKERHLPIGKVEEARENNIRITGSRRLRTTLRARGPLTFCLKELNLTASDGLRVSLEDDGLRQLDVLLTKRSPSYQVSIPGVDQEHYVRLTLQVIAPRTWWGKLLSLGRQPTIQLVDPEIEAKELAWPTLEVARMESLTSTSLPSNKEPPSVFLWVVDTLRADHLGTYGYSRDTSPNLDALAREAVVFTGAVAQSSWTRPSVASILTGKYVRNHGILTVKDALAKEVPTLAEALSLLGYRTAGWITNANIRGVGLGRGFDLYQRPRPFGRYLKHYSGHVPSRATLKWIDNQPDGNPLFGYLHVSDPHAPYLSSSDFRDYWPVEDRSIGGMESIKKLPSRADPPTLDLLSLYDSEIRQVDDALGQFIAGLKERSLYQGSLIVITADHGEEFFDHGGWQHGQTLYAEQLRVPFVIKWPKGKSPFELGSHISAPVSHVDIPATILQAAGSSSPSFDGFAISKKTIANSLTLAEIGTAQAVVTSSMKLIIDHKRKQVLLYDRINDPVDRVNLATQRPRTLEYHFRLLQLLTERGSSQVAEQAQQDEETLEQLRALGYVE